MNRQQRTVLFFGLLLISIAVLGRAQQADAAQAVDRSAAVFASDNPQAEDCDASNRFLSEHDRSARLQ